MKEVDFTKLKIVREYILGLDWREWWRKIIGDGKIIRRVLIVGNTTGEEMWYCFTYEYGY